LDAQSNTPAVLIGGGIGITPMMAMLRWSLQHQPQRVVHLYYGTRNSAEHVYKTTLEEIARNNPNVHLHVVYSKPLPQDNITQDYRHQGHVDMALLKQTLPHGGHAFYICGSAPMMESLVPALVQWGVSVSDIHFEAFGPASVRLPQADTQPETVLHAPVEIHFQRSGRTLLWGGKQSNLLDFAEMHGIRVESGCRSGSCGSCLTPIASGSVGYDNPPDFDLIAGQCLLCVGKPRTDVTLDA
jgi:ferredoxin-NADP reductase